LFQFEITAWRWGVEVCVGASVGRMKYELSFARGTWRCNTDVRANELSTKGGGDGAGKDDVALTLEGGGDWRSPVQRSSRAQGALASPAAETTQLRESKTKGKKH